MGYALVTVIDIVFSLLVFILFASAIASWLVAFGVINTRNQAVAQILRMLDSITDPMLRPIRRIVPPLGSVDMSFIVLWLIIIFLRVLFDRALAPLLINTLG
jgi:YggT family protein